MCLTLVLRTQSLISCQKKIHRWLLLKLGEDRELTLPAISVRMVPDGLVESPPPPPPPPRYVTAGVPQAVPRYLKYPYQCSKYRAPKKKKWPPGVWRPGTAHSVSDVIRQRSAPPPGTVRIHGRGRGRIVIERGRGCSAKIDQKSGCCIFRRWPGGRLRSRVAISKKQLI